MTQYKSFHAIVKENMGENAHLFPHQCSRREIYEWVEIYTKNKIEQLEQDKRELVEKAAKLLNILGINSEASVDDFHEAQAELQELVDKHSPSNKSSEGRKE